MIAIQVALTQMLLNEHELGTKSPIMIFDEVDIDKGLFVPSGVEVFWPKDDKGTLKFKLDVNRIVLLV